jgi:hypothetical protein
VNGWRDSEPTTSPASASASSQLMFSTEKSVTLGADFDVHV